MTLVLNGTNGVSDVDGSASTPAIRGSDTNTGIFFPAADTIAFAEGGAEVARFDSSGNLGIGTSSPSDRLTVISAGTQVGSTNFRRISRIGLATTDASVLIGYDISAGSGILASTNDFPLAFWTSSSGTYAERARIDSSGNLLVGTTTSSGSGNLIAAGVYNNTTASGANVQVDNTGPGLLRRSTSSIVYKTNVEPIDAAYIANALKFRPVWYRSLCDGDRKDWSW